jgi:signal transduction histidine kinase
MTDDTQFPRLVALACHDLRTPLATVHGFARTLARQGLEEPAARYVEMIDAASQQLAELLDELALVAKIEAGRFEPRPTKVDSLQLARAAAAELEDGVVRVSGEGATVAVEEEATRRAVRQLARAARRHGGLESVDLVVEGPTLVVSPVTATAPAVVTGEELRELGAAAGVALVRALGGTVEVDGERLLISLPTPSQAS